MQKDCKNGKGPQTRRNRTFTFSQDQKAAGPLLDRFLHLCRGQQFFQQEGGRSLGPQKQILCFEGAHIIVVSSGKKISMSRWNAMSSVWIFAMTDDRLYCLNSHHGFRLVKLEVAQAIADIAEANRVDFRLSLPISEGFSCFGHKGSFGHQLCQCIKNMNAYNEHKFTMPVINGFDTPHLSELVKLCSAQSDFVHVPRINSIYPVKRLFVDDHFAAWPAQVVELPTMNLVVAGCSAVGRKPELDVFSKVFMVKPAGKEKLKLNQMGPGFVTDSKECQQFIKELKLQRLAPEDWSMCDLIYILYHAKLIVVQWGALSFLPALFAKQGNPNSQTVIVLKHPRYHGEQWKHPTWFHIVLVKQEHLMDTEFTQCRRLINQGLSNQGRNNPHQT